MHISLKFLSSKLEQMAEVFNLSWKWSYSILMRILLTCTGKDDKGKKWKERQNKNRHSPEVHSLGQIKSLYQMRGFEHPHPNPRRCISLVLTIQVPNRICDFLNFFVFCRWKLSPSYPIKVYNLYSGCFHTFSCLTIIILRTV